MTSLNRLAMTGKRGVGMCACVPVCHQTVAERAQGNCANEGGGKGGENVAQVDANWWKAFFSGDGFCVGVVVACLFLSSAW